MEGWSTSGAGDGGGDDCDVAECVWARTSRSAAETLCVVDSSLSAEARADMVVKEMTLEEKISLLHGQGSPFGTTGPTESNGGAGYSVGIARLGIPAIQMADSAYGVTRGAASGRYSTALPNNLAAASAWDAQAAFEYGALIGRELRQQGYSMSLGGGVNLPREPRNGRTLEYQGEDPFLAGTLVGNFVKGVQSEHVIGDLKHYAINDQESGRNAVDANIDKRSMRESDLLAFEIALKISDAGAFMCSYNRVNGDYACENSYLLTEILRKDFQFKGFVVSDWGGMTDGKSVARGTGPGATGKEFLWGCAAESGGERRSFARRAERARASHCANDICEWTVRQSGGEERAGCRGRIHAGTEAGGEKHRAAEREECAAAGGSKSTLGGIDWRTCGCGSADGWRFRASGCAGGNGCCAGATTGGSSTTAELREAASVAAEFAAEGVEREIGFEQGDVCGWR